VMHPARLAEAMIKMKRGKSMTTEVLKDSGKDSL